MKRPLDGRYQLQSGGLAIVCGVIALFKGDLGWQAPVLGVVLVALGLAVCARGLLLRRRARRGPSVPAQKSPEEQLTFKQSVGFACLGLAVVALGVWKYATEAPLPSFSALFNLVIILGGGVLVVACAVGAVQARRRTAK